MYVSPTPSIPPRRWRGGWRLSLLFGWWRLPLNTPNGTPTNIHRTRYDSPLNTPNPNQPTNKHKQHRTRAYPRWCPSSPCSSAASGSTTAGSSPS